MELTDIVQMLRRGAWFLVILTVVGIAGALAVTAATPKEYQASTKLFVAVQTGATSAQEIAQGSSAAQTMVANYSVVVTSEPVLDPVIAEFGLETSARGLASRVTATTAKNAVNMRIGVTDANPAVAADLANAIAASFDKVIADLEQPMPDGSSPVKITTLEKAVAPSTPSEPRPAFNAALGAVAGLLIGLAVLFARSILDTRVRSVAEIESMGLPVLGALGHNGDHTTAPLTMRDAPRGADAEAFRDLRTNIAYSSSSGSRPVILITSALQGEGKTTAAANLALATAETGTRVLLVDADLRRPRLAEILGLEGATGLSDVLVGRAEPDDVIQRWGTAGLHVLPAGRIPPNPSELLGSASMRVLIEQFAESYDIVIIDAPPVLPVTDAAVLSTLCGGVVMVTAARQSRRPQLRSATDRLQGLDARVLGVVVTKVRQRSRRDFTQGVYGGYGQYESAADAPRPPDVVRRGSARRSRAT